MSAFLNDLEVEPQDGYTKIHSNYLYRITISHQDGVWGGCDMFGSFATNGRERRVVGGVCVIKLDDRFLLLSNSVDDDELGMTFLDVKTFKEAKVIVDANQWMYNDDFTYIKYTLDYASVQNIINGFISK